MLSKTFGKLEFESNFLKLRALGSLEQLVLNKREQPPCAYSYSNDHPQLLSSCQRYSAVILKWSYPETTVIRRTNPPQSAHCEARLICMWIKDVQRQRCVFFRAMLPCRLKAFDGGRDNRASPWMETSEHHAHFQSECMKWEVKGASYYGRWRNWTFLVFFSRSSTGQHDYSAGTEREMHGGIDTKWNPTDGILLLLNQSSLQKAVLFSLPCSPFLRLFLSVCHFLFSSLPFPVVSVLYIPTYLTWLSLLFSAHFTLLFWRLTQQRFMTESGAAPSEPSPAPIKLND